MNEAAHAERDLRVPVTARWRRRANGRTPWRGMPRPNWFFAFPLDGAFVAELPAPPSALRRYHVADVHLTLAFLGGVGEAGAQRALAALDEQLARETPPALDVTLGEVVPMGPRGRYSALSALLEQGRAAATEYLSSLRDPLTEAASGRREKRAAKPHVTLARPRPRASAADRAAALQWAAGLDLRAVQARLDRIALYTWSEDRRERLFRIVTERCLR